MTLLSKEIARLPERVRQRKEREGKTWRAVAGEAGIPFMTLYGAAVENRKPNISTLVLMAKWLEVHEIEGEHLQQSG